MSNNERRYTPNLQGLLRFCTENTKVEDAPEATQFEPMSEEKKTWLKEALKAITSNDPVKKMIEDIKIILKANDIEEGSSVLDDKELALEDLSAYCEDIDFANDFYKIGGFEIFPILLNGPHSSLKWRTAELIATLAQNNPFCQEKILHSDGLFSLLLKKLNDEKEKDEVKIKSLYAISCITREHEKAQDEFIKLEGFRILLKLLHSSVEKLQIKSLFLISSLSAESNKIKDLLCNMGLVEELIELLCEEPHSEAHKHTMAALLNIVQDHLPAQKECTKPCHKLKDLIIRRTKELSGDEAFLDEVENLNTIFKLCFK